MSVLDHARRPRPSEGSATESRPLTVVLAPPPAPKSSQRRPPTVVPAPPPTPKGSQRFQYLSGAVDGSQLSTMLNGYGKEGWRLRSCLPRHTRAGIPTGTYLVILEREFGSTASGAPIP